MLPLPSPHDPMCIDVHSLATVRGGVMVDPAACKEDMKGGATAGGTVGAVLGITFLAFTGGWSALAPAATVPIGAGIPYLFSKNCRTARPAK